MKIKFKNNSEIIILPSNPESVRGNRSKFPVFISDYNNLSVVQKRRKIMSIIKDCITCQNSVLKETDKTAQQKCDNCLTVKCCGTRMQNPTQYEAFEFNVGDYVETTDGYVGYIRKVNMETEGFFKGYCHIYATLVDRGNLECSCYDTELVNYFKRIGKYDFTKQLETTKIEKLPYEKLIEAKDKNGIVLKNIWMPVDTKDIIDKLNEIIDRVNKIGEKND